MMLLAALMLQAAGGPPPEIEEMPLSYGALKFADPNADHGLPDPVEAGWQGEKVCEVLRENDAMRALRCTFPPGVGHERHYHAPHFGYILQGGVMQITDKDGIREQETPTGATWWSEGVEWHEALNIGKSETVYIIVEPKPVVTTGESE